MRTQLMAVTLAVAGCEVQDPLYCDEQRICTDPARPFCDLVGEFPSSGGVARTCIPDPFGNAEDGGPSDASPDAAVTSQDASAGDGGPCSWRRLSRLANVNEDAEADFVGSIDLEGNNLYFFRPGAFLRAERALPDQPFGQPLSLEFDAEDLKNPEISASGRELLYEDAFTGTIGRATRLASDATFDEREDTGLVGLAPSLSGDDRSVYFVHLGRVEQATREDIGGSWSDPIPVLDVETDFSDVDVSSDELRLLLVANPLTAPADPLLIAERSSKAADFAEPVPVDPAILFPDAVSYTYASWTADGRQLIVSVFRDGDNDMYYATCE